jgi:tungstate transport system ATP-binding protein
LSIQFSIIYRREGAKISYSPTLLELNGISKKYDKEVLRVDRLELQKGCIYGIIGPSGAGKSTLLRIINLLTPPSGGEIKYRGQPVADSGQERLALQRKMSLVFQQTLLFRESVFNNVAFGLKARGYSKLEIESRVNILLEQIGMSTLRNRRADTLSGGEAQRVAIARAVAFEPELLLLDEPTANLDPGNIVQIENMITGLSRKKGITIIMVTHNVFQARRIADQVMFVHQGRIVETGPTEKIFTEPEKASTRQFVEGRMVY